jgi:excinuclease ABC subunit A
MVANNIIIRGARQHNLKNFDIELPRNRLIVITGLSGSGKSTLAFDTLYAEGQRRYVESLSPYARQFLARLEKPDVDLIDGLSPAIAIEQKSTSHNPRSTIGTVTEIYDYLRLLYARVGTPYCHVCGQAISAQSLDQIIDQILSLKQKTRIVILAPIIANQKGAHAQTLQNLRRNGFARVRINGRIMELEKVYHLNKTQQHTIDVVVDRLIIQPNIYNRLTDSVELALGQSEGRVIIQPVDEKGNAFDQEILFNEKAACVRCQISYPPMTPASFSFNSPAGACPKCDGLGSVTEFSCDLIVPNPNLSLREGAIAPWANRNSLNFIDFLDDLTRQYDTDIYTPFNKLPPSLQKILLYGSKSKSEKMTAKQNQHGDLSSKFLEGLIPQLQRRYQETTSLQTRKEIKRYLRSNPCPQCHGARLKIESRSVKIQSLTIDQVTALSIEKAYRHFKQLTLEGKNALIADRIVKEICDRLGFLNNVGLSYLTLDRPAFTLSGGESQRIRLATQIGSKLSGVLYVLDEPSIGLHPRDHQRLLKTLQTMRNIGNTVLVVEHDEETIRAADYVVDMGPGAGIHGGAVVFSGSPQKLLSDQHSLTGQYLSGRRRIQIPSHRRSGSGHKIVLAGARQNNLKNLTLEFPLGCLICVTGVSGSGKSTLVLETLYRALAQRLYRSRETCADFDEILGLEDLDKVIHIDQTPIGRTPKSNPGTYTGVLNFIRDVFSKTPEARIRGYRPGRFSFNVKGGRCESCQGDGIIKIEMHFLPDIYVPCDVCHGKRYNRETLEVRYKGKNIAEILDMTVNQGLDFFGRVKPIRSKFQTLVDVGLGYIHIGQSATTLSGGEAQRVKLARELSKKGTGGTLYILDEPTTGLHMEDIKNLLQILDRLVAAGNTVVVIEHNLDVIKTADHIIDLGPEGGDKGGYIVGVGSPETLARNPDSYTGQYLRKVLDGAYP